jgi:hypothetical protein
MQGCLSFATVLQGEEYSKQNGGATAFNITIIVFLQICNLLSAYSMPILYTCQI